MTTALIQDESWRTLFLRVLRNKGTVRAAAEQIGLTTRSVRKAIKDDPAFAELVQEAMEDNTELLEEVALRRALEGDNLMTIFMLKARKPKVYRDNYREDGQSGPVVMVKTYVGFSPDEWDKRVADKSGAAPQVIDGQVQVKALVDSGDGNSPDLIVPATALADTPTA